MQIDGTTQIQAPGAITPDSAAQFARSFAAAELDDSCRVIILSGHDGVFCRGMHPSQPGAVDLRRHLQDFADCLLRMRFCAKPVIAAVDGVAIGGGLGLAATADMVIATDRSTFGLPEALFGFVPAVILPLLLERMRPKDCRLWMLSGYSRSAAEALTTGLVDAICPVPELEHETARAVRQFSRTNIKAVQHVKRMAARSDLEPAVRSGVQATLEMLGDPAVSSAFLRYFEDGTLPWEES